MSVDQSGRRSYLPGAWFGIFGDNAAVLLPPSEKRRVAALWELLDDGADFDEVLDALIATGLRDLPGFLLLSDTDEATRIVVRGPARATFTTDDGTVEVEAAGAGTWVERTVPGVRATVLDVSDPADETEPGTPLLLHSGLVRVSRVETPAVEQAPVELAPVVEQAPAEDEDSSSAAGLGAVGAAGAAGAALASPSAVARPDDEQPVDDQPADEQTEPLGEPTPLEPEPYADPAPYSEAEPESGVPPFAEPELEPQLEPEPEVGEPTEVMSLADLEAAAAEEAPLEEAPLEEAPVEHAPVEHVPEAFVPEAFVPEPAQDGPPPAPAFGSGAPQQRPQWSPAPAPANPFGAAPVDPGPGRHQDHAAAPEAPLAPPVWGEPAGADQGADQDVDEDVDQDVDQGATPADGSPALAPSDGPGPSDHDGNTHAGDYDPAVYARSQPGIPGQQLAPSVTSRPVARLLMSNGETIDVDRAILVGRAPEARRFTATEQPRLVTVPSPNQEISSTHLEVRPGSGADHGSAVVTDMGSTNGTVLVQPGLSPEDLQPGIAVQLIPGAVIDLGDGLTIQVANP